MEIDIAQAEREIAELQAKVNAEKARLAKMTPDQADAERLHQVLCRHNHTDGCGWYYETWENTRGQYSEHMDYLRKVQALKKNLAKREVAISFDEALDIFTTIRGY